MKQGHSQERTDELVDNLVAVAGRNNEMDCTEALAQLKAEAKRRLKQKRTS